MKLFSRPVLALALGASLAATLSSCDYRHTPGLDNQRRDFTKAPGWRNEDVNRDSINYKQVVIEPGGVGSAAEIRNGGVDAQRRSAPAGRSSASGQTASGQMAQPDQSNPTNAPGPNTSSPGTNTNNDANTNGQQ